jgi:hypothetical protein
VDVNPPIPKDTETEIVNAIPPGLTLNTLLNNGHNLMRNSFFSYSAKDKNCQDFIMGLFYGSSIGNNQVAQFIKQNTKSLFDGLTSLRKFSITITDIGGRFNVITNGAGIKKKTKPKRKYNRKH